MADTSGFGLFKVLQHFTLRI